MIVPQMQQRWTGYSSEGSRSLLSSVLGARQASVQERQAIVAEANQKLSQDKFGYLKDMSKNQRLANQRAGQEIQTYNKTRKLKEEWLRNRDKWKAKDSSLWSIGSKGIFQGMTAPFLGLKTSGKIGDWIGLEGQGLIDYTKHYLSAEGADEYRNKEFDNLVGSQPKLYDDFHIGEFQPDGAIGQAWNMYQRQQNKPISESLNFLLMNNLLGDN